MISDLRSRINIANLRKSKTCLLEKGDRCSLIPRGQALNLKSISVFNSIPMCSPAGESPPEAGDLKNFVTFLN